MATKKKAATKAGKKAAAKKPTVKTPKKSLAKKSIAKKGTRTVPRARAKPPAPATPQARVLKDNEFAPLVPYLRVDGGKRAVEFYQKAFGAKVRMMMEADQDKSKLMHASLVINGGELMLSDTFAEFDGETTVAPSSAKTTTVSIHLAVDSADKWFKRAVDAGAQVLSAPADMFWGDRYGQVRDPFGHIWAVGSPVKKAG